MPRGILLCPTAHPRFHGCTLCEVLILQKDSLLSSKGFWLLHKVTPPFEQLLHILPFYGSLSHLPQHFLLLTSPPHCLLAFGASASNWYLLERTRPALLISSSSILHTGICKYFHFLCLTAQSPPLYFLEHSHLLPCNLLCT